MTLFLWLMLGAGILLITSGVRKVSPLATLRNVSAGKL